MIKSLALILIFAASTALATPWDIPDGNGGWKENPDCTGSCRDTGVPNKPDTPTLPDNPNKDKKEKEEQIVQCGCGYFVRTNDFISKKRALKACEKLTEKQREGCHWPNGIYPGDKG